MQNNSLKQWFVFTKRDRNAAFILIALITIVIVLPYLSPEKKLEIHLDKQLQQELDAYKKSSQQSNNNSFYVAGDTTITDTVKHALFSFDPNTLPEDGFIQLGLSPKTAHTLINYRNKGGYFRKPEDIRKIYGLSKVEADKLIPYVHIASASTNQKLEYNYDKPAINTITHQYKKTDINAATAEDWTAFPGIGDVIANRIVKFRASMHGFKTVEQVGKTYGLSDSVFQAIKPYLYLKDSTGN